jgi:hypothetical protein
MTQNQLKVIEGNNPVKIYKELEGEIPSLQEKVSSFFNQIHNTNKPKEFWWVVAGEHAIQARYLLMLDTFDKRLLSECKKHCSDKLVPTETSQIILKLIGQDTLFGSACGLYQFFEKEPSNSSLMIEDKVGHFNTSSAGETGTLYLPFDRLTTFVNVLHKIKKKIKYLGRKKNDTTKRQDIENKFNDKFISYFLSLLQKDLIEDFPVWFVHIGRELVTENKKWTTHFGNELNIFQWVLLATSYMKYNDKNINLISHGAVTGELGIWQLFRFSLFKNLKLEFRNSSQYLNKRESSAPGILYCPIQLPYYADLLSLAKWKVIMNMHKKVIDILSLGVADGKKIRIRTKDFDYLSDYNQNLCAEELSIPRELASFEESYSDYSTIVTMPYGTIASKCHRNNVGCLVFHSPFTPTDKLTYEFISSLPGVYHDEYRFIGELEKLVNDLPRQS